MKFKILIFAVTMSVISSSLVGQVTTRAQSKWRRQLTGALVDENGKSLAVCAFSMHAGAVGPKGSSILAYAGKPNQRSLANGRFIVSYRIKRFHRSEPQEYVLHFIIYDELGRPERLGRRRIEETLEGTMFDLGKVVCEMLPVLVSGRVVDELGNPLAEQKINLMRDKRKRIPRKGLGSSLNSSRCNPEITDTLTDAKGRFLVRAVA